MKQLLNQHGAKIAVESVEGEGTLFTLKLRRGYAYFPEGVAVQHQTGEPSDATIKSVFLDQFESEMKNSTNLEKLVGS